MRFTGVSTVKQRGDLLRAVDEGGLKVTEACRLWGISRETYYFWRRRFEAEGEAGLEDRAPTPKSMPGRMSSDLEARIVSMRTAHKRWGARRIRTELRRSGMTSPPARSTIHRVLVRNNLVNNTPSEPVASKRFERARPGELVQTDAKEVVLTTGKKVHVVSVLDDHSRYCCAAVVRESLDCESAIAAFDAAVAECGLPYCTLADNGSYFTGRLKNSVNFFERHLWGYGVLTINGRTYHPQTQGKAERYHRTLSEWIEDHGPFETVEQLQASVDEFRHDYNNLRPHQGIGDITPAERLAQTPWMGPDPEGTADRRVRSSIRKVGSNGNLQYADWSIGLGSAWAKRSVKVVDYGHVIEVRDEDDQVVRKVEPDPDRHYLGSGKTRGRPTLKTQK